MAKIWIWISSLFPKSKIGILFSTLFANAATSFAKQILDPQNQIIAYSFVVNLSLRTDLTNAQKRDIFNAQMRAQAIVLKKQLSESVISCLRELAVNALKANDANDANNVNNKV